MIDEQAEHADAETLLRVLWLSANTPGAAEEVSHLLRACPGCSQAVSAIDIAPTGLGLPHFRDETLRSILAAARDIDNPSVLYALEHLLDQCPRCRAKGQMILHRIESRASCADSLTRIGEALAGRIRGWQEAFDRQREEAPSLSRQLLDQPAARRALIVANSARFRSWPLVDLLCAESRRLAAESPSRAIEAAKAAIEVAERLESLPYGSRIVQDVKAEAWAFLGNALRAAGDLAGADHAFSVADQRLAEGSGLEAVTVDVLSLKASLRTAQRRFDEARALLQRAAGIYREVEDPHQQGRILVKAADCCWQAGETEAAIQLLESALPLIDSTREPRLLLCTVQYRVLYLVDLGRLREAEALLPRAWELSNAIGRHLDRVRLRWTEGRIDAALKRFPRAMVAFAEVKDSFRQLDMPYDAALVSLELALLYFEQGHLREMKLLALEMMPVFAESETQREALAAVTLFARAAAEEVVTSQVIDRALKTIRRLAGQR